MEEAQQIRLEIPSSAEYVSLARRMVVGIATRMHFDPAEVSDVKLAVGEACNNAVRHGAPSSEHPYVVIVCNILPTALEIEVSNGLPEEQECQCPSICECLDFEKEGGMGLFIMKQLMDEVEMKWDRGKAKVRMLKRLRVK